MKGVITKIVGDNGINLIPFNVNGMIVFVRETEQEEFFGSAENVPNLVGSKDNTQELTAFNNKEN